MKPTKEQKEKAKQDLIKMFNSNKVALYTICKHVSRTGMMRHIDVIFITEDRTPININWYIEQLGLFNRAKHYNTLNADSLRVSGCGMDMGYYVVSTLSSVLFNDYKVITQRWL